MTDLYVLSITRRFTFSVGVSSPRSMEKSCSSSADLLRHLELREALQLRRSPPSPSLRARIGIVEELCAVGPQDVLDLRPLLELLPVRHDEHDGEFALVADHHRLADVLVRLERVLDRLRRDVLAARGDDDVLLAIGDREEAVAQLADVARVEPALGVDRLGASPSGLL